MNAMTSSALVVNGTVTSGSSSTVVQLDWIRFILLLFKRMRGGERKGVWEREGVCEREGVRDRERDGVKERERDSEIGGEK
jgi:hypothetical protein